MSTKLEEKNILLKHIISTIQDAKGKEIVSLDLRKIESAIFRYFIICTGSSNTHVNAIEGKIKKKISQDLGEKPWRIEGKNTGEWILIDYYDIIVHIFQQKTREFYNIEDFWGDAKFTKYNDEK